MFFRPGHIAAVANDYEAAAERRDEQAAELTQAGDLAGATQCREWAERCRAVAADIRTGRPPTY